MADSVGGTHHVKIDNSYLLVYPNSYFKRAAPAFGARFAGGDPDYSQLGFWQHWGQSCWIGGVDQASWEDDAMYDYAVGTDTSQHDLIALSRGLAPAGTGFALGGDQRRRFHVWKNKLFCFDYLKWSSDSKVWRYNEGTSEWDLWRTFTDLTVGAAASFSNDFYVGTSGTKLRKYNGGKWKQIKKPKKRRQTPRMMKAYRGRLYVGFGRRLYRLKGNDKWDGNAVFFDGQGVDHYIDAELHQGFLYMASKNGHILRTDGNNTHDMYQFGSKVNISSIESYDGKLFVFTNEWYDDEDEGELVVYQMSGAAVTEIARHGRVGITTQSGGSAEVARRMFYGASSLLGMSDETGFGIAVYDAREDAHSIFACERDVTTYPDAGADGKDYIIDDIRYWGGRFFVHVRGHGVFFVRYTHRDLDRAVADFDNTWTGSIAVGNDEGGVLVSSEFNAGTPGLEKIWRKIDVTADLLATGCEVHVGYSTDGGQTWTDAGSLTKTGADTRYTKSFYLNDVRSERFKYKLQLDTTDTDYSPIVRAVVVQFLPNPEPNWTWSFTAVLATKVSTLDGADLDQDVDALKLALETAFRDDQLVTFTDIDGTQWATGGGQPGALIQDITFSAPFIDASSAGDIEYNVEIRLIEATETP